MPETLQQFAELVGRCLARRWLRERDALKNDVMRPESHFQRANSDHAESAAPPCGRGVQSSDPAPDD